MIRVLAILCVATVAVAQQPQTRPAMPEQTVKLDYKGPYLEKIVNGYGERKPALLPSSICQISVGEVLRINARIRVADEGTNLGDLEVIQRKSLVNGETHGEELLYQAFNTGLRSITIRWGDLYDKIKAASELEEKVLFEETEPDATLVEYKVIFLDGWKEVSSEVRQGTKVVTKTPQPKAITLYAVKDKVVAREGEVVDALIKGIDTICDNDKSFQELRYQPNQAPSQADTPANK